MEHLVQHSVDILDSLGIGFFHGLNEFIQFLINLGQDPVHTIATLSAHIAKIGGETIATLEELAHGVMTYGLTGYFERKVTQAVQPLKNALTQQSTRGHEVAHVHTTTLATMQLKLNALQTGDTSSGMKWEGASVEEMNTSFTTISQAIKNQVAQIDTSGEQDTLNRNFLTILEGIGKFAQMLAILDVLLIAASAIVVVASGGTLALADVALIAGILQFELELLLVLVAADALYWLVGTIALYFKQTAVAPAPAPPVNPGKTDGFDPKQNPDPDQYAKMLEKAITLLLGAAILNKAIKDLSTDERETVIQELLKKTGCDRAAIEALLNAYPDATVDEILKALAIKRVIQQFQDLKAQMQKKRTEPSYNPADKKAAKEIQDSFDRAIEKIDKEINGWEDFTKDLLDHKITDPGVIQKKFNNLYNNLNGMWAEWKVAEYYGDKGDLLYFGKDSKYGGINTEIDVAVRDGTSIRFIQIKAYKTSFGVSDPNSSDGLSSNFRRLLKQVKNTDELFRDPKLIGDLKKMYPWFDGTIKNETDLINTQPLDPDKGGWKDVAEKLRTDYPDGAVESTDPNDPGMQSGGKNYDPGNPFNDPNFRGGLTPSDPSNTTWCQP